MGSTSGFLQGKVVEAGVSATSVRRARTPQGITYASTRARVEAIYGQGKPFPFHTFDGHTYDALRYPSLGLDVVFGPDQTIINMGVFEPR